MSTRRHHPLPLPEYWTPVEALAVFELLDLLRDHLWNAYGPDIQQALREQISADRDSRQCKLPFDSEPPF